MSTDEARRLGEQLTTLLTRHQGVSAERAHDLARAGELLAAPGLTRLRDEAALAAGLWEQVRHELAALLTGLDGPGAGAVEPGERLRAGQALGLLGDPRVPLGHDEWRASLAALATTFTARGEHYWRYVPAGHYWFGGWEEHDPYAGPLQRDQWVERLPVEAFWLARLPVTVAQFAQFVADGYRDGAYWTPHGHTWRADRTAPMSWGQPGYSGANQSVVFVSWYEATAYCRWLSAQLAAALPAGFVIRLPSEAEWEAAATYDGTERRRPYPWGDAAPTAERAVFGAWGLRAPAPVGLCPTGAAACGALDLVGTVWEPTASAEEDYPRRANALVDDYPAGPVSVPLRGGSWAQPAYSARSGARHAYVPHNANYYDAGLRLALAARRPA